MADKTILILGAGVGGLVAANELRRLLPRRHRIVLVERNLQHAFAPSFLWLMSGDRTPQQITRDLRQLVRGGVEVIHEEAHSIDLAGRRLAADGKPLNWDYLVIALGADLAPESISGLVDAAHTFYTFEGTQRLRDALQVFNGGHVAVVVGAVPYKCPGAPHEAVMLLADFFRKQRLSDKVDLHLFTPEPQPMPVAGAELGEAVRKMLEGRGIRFHPLHKLSAVDPRSRELRFEGKEPFRFDLLVGIPPHRGPRLVRDAGLANEAGWVPVDRATLATKREKVYAIGDVTAIPIPGRWKPDVPLMLPKAGVFAHAQGLVVAHRIAADIAGTKSAEVFCGDGFCMLEAGGDQAGFAFGNFFAEPTPQVQLRNMGKVWHLGKVLFERWWLAPFGPKREALRLGLTAGAKALRIPAVF